LKNLIVRYRAWIPAILVYLGALNATAVCVFFGRAGGDKEGIGELAGWVFGGVTALWSELNFCCKPTDNLILYLI
jgi:hypothetical protein